MRRRSWPTRSRTCTRSSGRTGTGTSPPPNTEQTAWPADDLAKAGFATTPRYGLYGVPDTSGSSYYADEKYTIPQYWQAISPYADITKVVGFAPLAIRYRQVYGVEPGIAAAETFDAPA